ncbi:MAG TPA: adenylate/guanylate cyclase domain-containing protein [Candidatus Limnocylindrales bacterium]|nr:adenylate/guanylate cyclase domain-containing protein [Candidatus Limnocylindrales bacterium]
MSVYSADEAAHRAGVTRDYIESLIQLGLLKPDPSGMLSDGDARRAACIEAMNRAGVPREALSAGVASGSVALDFLDDPVYERFAATSDETFAELAGRTGIAIEMLGIIRESLGSPPPTPDDYVRESELAIVPYVDIASRAGYAPDAIESLLRVAGDSMRRIAETEGGLFYRDILSPALARGLNTPDLETDDMRRLNNETDTSIVALYHGQQAHAWLRNVVNGVGSLLANAGLHAASERQPAICFLDITGYTRLTQERGDAAAAKLAENLSRIVQRTSASHNGKPVKWLGDGVMVYFEDPGQAVAGALDMVAALREAGLPPGHVGIATGEVIFQQGDYYGQTVNLAARIADFARPGEVLVSAAVVEAAQGRGLSFTGLGPVELKGVAEPIDLATAARSV